VTDGRVGERNAPCPCGSGRRYKHCCGDPTRAARDPKVRTRRTFVVLGCPRGGTSLLAGALHHAGVNIGRFQSTQYEDPDFKLPVAEAPNALARLAPAIRARNEQFEHWGWKLPNNIYYIGSIAHLLVNPTYLIVYRDPREIARSSARHDGRDWDAEEQNLLAAANAHTALLRRFEQSFAARCRVFHLEAIHGAPVAFVDRFIALLAPLPVDRDRLLAFVDPAGGYH
jgi:hypothetical protein